MVFSCALALLLQNALQLFEVLLVLAAGTGLIFILRWFLCGELMAWSEDYGYEVAQESSPFY